MIVLGINAYHGDASAALVADGRLIAAAEEERFTRIKHAAGFPRHAIRWCVETAGIRPAEIDHIAISRRPSAHLYRKILYTLAHQPHYRFLKNRLANAARVTDVRHALAETLGVAPSDLRAVVHRVEHHRAHLASSFFVSGFDQAALLSLDGFGDFVSTMWGIGRDRTLAIEGMVAFPHSLGVLYTAATQYLGFPHYGDEYKVMGLSAYGEPIYRDAFRRIVRNGESLRFRLDLSYFRHHSHGVSMTWDEGAPTLDALFSEAWTEQFGPSRRPEAALEPHHAHLAASLQAVLEEVIFDLLNRLFERTRLTNLCLAGGVALNCVVNGKILTHTPFERVYIQPAAHDGGTSIGAAFYVWHQVLGQPRRFTMDHAFWGPAFSDPAIRRALDEAGLTSCHQERERLAQSVAERVAAGQIVGLFQDRMEFGPRALGHRSIIADPRRAEMKDILNRRIKHREPFRPFAPSVLEQAQGRYFEQTHRSPFMLMAYRVKPEKRGEIPAAIHVDGTARVQTVSRENDPFFWEIIHRFERLTGVPVVVNTSFNENEPIVCTPQEAIECFLRTHLDALAMGNYLVVKDRETVPLCRGTSDRSPHSARKATSRE